MDSFEWQTILMAVEKFKGTDPELYALMRGSMQDPRQSHIIHEEEDPADL